MAETIAAFGLAANVLQFVDCGYGIVKTAHRLKSSENGATASNTEIELLARNLSKTMKEVQAGKVIPISPELSQSVSACVSLSDDLVQMLEGLKIDLADDSAWKRAKASVRVYRKASEVKALEERLGRFRTQICDHLNFGLLTELVSQAASEIAFRKNILDRVEALAVSVAGLAEARVWDSTDPTLERKKEELFTRMVNGMKGVLTTLTPEIRINRVLKSLHFRQIKERVSEVNNAHPDTFGWIFGDNPKANLVQWMSSIDRNGIYWVSGNAGSGKSTLMKFLVNHESTRVRLQQWAGDHRLITCSHFFWSAGNPIQKSQEGLFRTILFQIMLQEPDLIPILCPERWADEAMDPWSRIELLETFRKLAGLDTCRVRICLFIDGLDEYRGDHRELLSLIFDISRSQHFKICASSRPWIEFRQAFERPEWKLSVHDLTSADILKYVKDKLCPARPAYEWMEGHDPALAGPLADEICRKAQGVFLWVFLVTQSLLKGLTNGDSFRDLRNRLEELPSDLEEYFNLMLGTIDTVYRRRTAKVFKTLMHAESSLPILLFHFIDLEEDDPDYAIKDTIKPVPESHIRAIVHPKRSQLIAQCKDLVRLSCDPHEPVMLRDRVSFLHRTVSDFFRNEAMDSILSARVGSEYEPRLTLLRAFLAMIKSIPPWWVPKKIIFMDRIRRFVLAVLFYARELEELQAAEPLHGEVLESLDAVLDELLCSPEAWRECFPETGCLYGFEVMARYSPFQYPREAIERLGPTEKARILHHALCPAIIIEVEEGFTFRVGTEVNIESLEKLLQLGLSPNLPLSDDDSGSTVWSSYLEALERSDSTSLNTSPSRSPSPPIYETTITSSSIKRRRIKLASSMVSERGRQDSQNAYLVSRLLCQHGADCQVKLQAGTGSKTVAADEILTSVLGQDRGQILAKILQRSRREG